MSTEPLDIEKFRLPTNFFKHARALLLLVRHIKKLDKEIRKIEFIQKARGDALDRGRAKLLAQMRELSESKEVLEKDKQVRIKREHIKLVPKEARDEH